MCQPVQLNSSCKKLPCNCGKSTRGVDHEQGEYYDVIRRACCCVVQEIRFPKFWELTRILLFTQIYPHEIQQPLACCILNETLRRLIHRHRGSTYVLCGLKSMNSICRRNPENSQQNLAVESLHHLLSARTLRSWILATLA